MAFRCQNSWIRNRERLAEKKQFQANLGLANDTGPSQHCTLFVGRCPDSITDEDITEYYKQLGRDAVVKISWVEKNGQFMGYGFVTFRSEKIASIVLSMPPPKVNGSRLVISDSHSSANGQNRKPEVERAEALKLLKSLDIKRGEMGVSESHRMRSFGQCLEKVEWSEEDLSNKPIKKDFSKFVTPAKVSESTLKSFMEENCVECSGLEVQPVLSFNDINFGENVKSLLSSQFQKPTAIQSLAWPVITKGKDIIGLAETGCGKTLAYLLPSLFHIRYQKIEDASKKNPVVLILGPTRELVIQIAAEASNLPNVSAVAAYGGAGAGGERVSQAVTILKGVDILIACPGRLIDFLEAYVVSLARVTYLVIDESDQMLNMGFLPQIKSIALQIRPDRQTLMFSATWTKAMWDIVKLFMHDPVKVVINKADERKKAVSTVKQHFIFCGDVIEKTTKLIRLLKQLKTESPDVCRILVFVNSKTHGDALFEKLQRHFPSVDTLSSEFPQDHRERVMEHFRNDPQGIMVATDVIGRGLDIKELNFVINYSLPNEFRRYIHRIGRTGRAGESGEAYSFFVEEDAPIASDLIKCLQDANQEPPLLLFEFAEKWRSLKKEKAKLKREQKRQLGEKQQQEVSNEVKTLIQGEEKTKRNKKKLRPQSNEKDEPIGKRQKKNQEKPEIAGENIETSKTPHLEVSQNEGEWEVLPLDDDTKHQTQQLASHLYAQTESVSSTAIPEWPLSLPWKSKPKIKLSEKTPTNQLSLTKKRLGDGCS